MSDWEQMSSKKPGSNNWIRRPCQNALRIILTLSTSNLAGLTYCIVIDLL
jgi:hypothetical protein